MADRLLVKISLQVMIPNETDTIMKVQDALRSAQETLPILGYVFEYYPPLSEPVEDIENATNAT